MKEEDLVPGTVYHITGTKETHLSIIVGISVTSDDKTFQFDFKTDKRHKTKYFWSINNVGYIVVSSATFLCKFGSRVC